jgi:outer membrane protein assembly factor BamD (BamD/ComL family)
MDDSRNKLAKKDFKAGELYYRQQKYPSAVIYFDRVLDLYGDTSWARSSLRIKGDALFAMKQYSQAADAYARFLNLYGDDPMHFVNKRLEESRKHPEPQPQTPPDTTMAAPDSIQSSLEP